MKIRLYLTVTIGYPQAHI